MLTMNPSREATSGHRNFRVRSVYRQREDGSPLRGPAEFVPFVERIRGAFPDINIVVEDVLCPCCLASMDAEQETGKASEIANWISRLRKRASLADLAVP